MVFASQGPRSAKLWPTRLAALACWQFVSARGVGRGDIHIEGAKWHVASVANLVAIAALNEQQCSFS